MAAGNISRAAANACDLKVKRLADFAATRKPEQKQTTRFSADELNSYLAFVLSPKYHPCLKSLLLTLEEGRMQAVAVVDFDRLGNTSSKLFPKLLGLVLSGAHTMTVRGQLMSSNGKAWFQLQEARFDTMTLPRVLVEEIITAVGRKQNPPFDPLRPSQLFYRIERTEVHAGYIVAYQ